jgi:hypothetical protein
VNDRRIKKEKVCDYEKVETHKFMDVPVVLVVSSPESEGRYHQEKKKYFVKIA